VVQQQQTNEEENTQKGKTARDDEPLRTEKTTTRNLYIADFNGNSLKQNVSVTCTTTKGQKKTRNSQVTL